MQQETVSKKKRIILLLTAALFVVSAIFSTAYIIKEANHKCNHTDCQICHTMQNCIKSITDLGSKPENAVFSSTVMFFAVLAISFVFYKHSSKTLIDLKIKLSN